jgi:enoyl-CoA hydratase/carnithine racemase
VSLAGRFASRRIPQQHGPGDHATSGGHARSIASEILEGGPEAVRITKQLLNSQTVEPDMERLQKLHEEVRRSPEAAEGLAAFRERRRPNW